MKKCLLPFRPALNLFWLISIFSRGSVGSSTSALIKRFFTEWTVLRQIKSMTGVFPMVVPSMVVAIPGSCTEYPNFHRVSLQRNLLVAEDGEQDCCKRFFPCNFTCSGFSMPRSARNAGSLNLSSHCTRERPDIRALFSRFVLSNNIRFVELE